MDFLRHFPYPQAHQLQQEALEALQKYWDSFDVFVIGAPTAFGKTAVARTIMNARHSVSTITPTNLLVDQFIAAFPETASLKRLDSYTCSRMEWSCTRTRSMKKSFCKGCPASSALAQAKYRRGPGVYNYHMYLAQKLYREILVVDEAHNLLPFLRSREEVILWRHDYKYPHSIWSASAIGQWVRGLTGKQAEHKKVKLLKEALFSRAPRYAVKRTRREFNGKGTVRGEPEDRDCLVLTPIDVSEHSGYMWPHNDVKKVILMSATIGPKDIEMLGLSRKRVVFIKCQSPILAESRPVIPYYVDNVSYRNMQEATVKLGEYISRTLAPHHRGEKGVIHATYGQAKILRELLTSPRFMFHGSDDKTSVYRRFRESAPEDGKILVASGMYEGIDLVDDAARWQAITKVPWPSLTDPAIKYLADTDPEWYTWEVWKTIIQACGRVCRTPQDWGVTYILDGTFQRVLDKASHQAPQWFLDALKVS